MIANALHAELDSTSHRNSPARQHLRDKAGHTEVEAINFVERVRFGMVVTADVGVNVDQPVKNRFPKFRLLQLRSFRFCL